jgi:hypothetical protein
MGQIQQNIVVDANTLKTVMCACGKILFESVATYKIVPALYSQTGKPTLLALHCLRCINCGKVRSIEEIVAEETKNPSSNIISAGN